jgi:hypothetical protein
VDGEDVLLTHRYAGSHRCWPASGRASRYAGAAIGQAVGAVLSRCKMAKHFQITITDEAFSFIRNDGAIAAEAALDGIYVLRTNLPAEQSDAATTVRAYRGLARVERALRSLKTVALEVRAAPGSHGACAGTCCFACLPPTLPP